MNDTIPAGFVRAVALAELVPGELQGITARGEAVCLARIGDDVYAVADRCPHADFPLSSGDLLPNGRVQCAWHGAQFDCRTGALCAGPATDDVRTYDVLLHDGDVYVRL